MENIKNILEEYLDEKMISNIIVDQFINEELSKKHKTIVRELNLTFTDPYSLTHFILKPDFIPSYTDDGIIYELTEEPMYNTEEDSFIFDGLSSYNSDENRDYDEDSIGYHRCIFDGSDCGFCNDCRYSFY